SKCDWSSDVCSSDLPLYSVLVKIDGSVIEAAEDLGANRVQVFRRVIFPMSMPGIMSGITMVFVPSVSTFIISKMLGGGGNLLIRSEERRVGKEQCQR